MKPKTKERILFNEFLKQNGCLRQFVRNFNKDDEFKNIRVLCKKQKPKRLIFMAFNWSESPEKGEYWAVLNKKWETLVNKQN